MDAPPLLLRDDPTVRAYRRAHPLECAATTLTGPQHVRLQLLLGLLFLLFLYDYKVFAAGLLFGLATFYAGIIAFKLLCVLLSLLRRCEIRVSAEEQYAVADELLPVYTVLIPMYREPEVAEKVVRAVDSLDYPHDRLDVKLLLEEDDHETVDLCRGLQLPDPVEVVVVPHAQPKTKPKACNHGLATARGEYLVIYDAEDRPDRDQLRKAVGAFRKRPEEVACLQAKLNFYNPHQNLLTQWFTLDYTAWFDLFLPGLHRLGVPIPLGGTSNHFRTDVLRELGGWDPFNLTEDCDLGVRLYRAGWRTEILDSTTWEEANSALDNWIRQRSRWVKGYIQTHLAHTRSHWLTMGELGAWGYFGFFLTVGGLSLTLLLNPFFWAVGLAYLFLLGLEGMGMGEGPWRLRYADTVGDLPGAPLTLWSQLSWLFWYAAVALLVANGAFVLVNLLACVRRRLWRLLPQALISPAYWVLISAAAWKGLGQLFHRPFYWEKTRHGLLGAEAEGEGDGEGEA